MCPTITVASFLSWQLFFRQTTECMRSGHFYRTTKLLDRQTGSAFKIVQRYKTGRDYRVPLLSFFSALCDFFSNFLSPKGPPFKVFDILQQTEVSKSPKGLPFQVFRHYDTGSKFLFFDFSFFFRKFFNVSKGSRLQFLKIFCNNNRYSKIPKGPLF